MLTVVADVIGVWVRSNGIQPMQSEPTAIYPKDEACNGFLPEVYSIIYLQ